ncbi:MAG: dephospho-CoA kinase [Alicyclobacillus herbarius]|uniref:dephospho-CoA kinase n=1 Tax=Alicyclobacillus herbarius TaxID=122960 RepID=UPI002355D963|nr:dephospho-CoA kinase [Alicyclobacillus herbarius]MCL6631106.1 dephospho-CoA kinase [Alicyclobacillus herbarius]
MNGLIVGLTGGIATGKSTVTGMLRELGAYVVDADVWARKVVEPGSEGLREVVAAFGDRILRSDGSLDRGALAAIVFQDEAARQRLNAITHPRVRSGMMSETKAYLSEHPGNPVVWDVPLLFEGETRHLVQRTIVVYTDEATQLARLMARNGYSEAEAKARIRAQMSIEEKRRLADYVIDNTGTLDLTREQVERIWNSIRSEAAGCGFSS